MPSSSGIKVTVINSGREKKLNEQSTIGFRLYREELDWVLLIDSDTCAEKRIKTRKTEHEEYIITGLNQIISTPGHMLITCRTIKQRKAC